MVCLRRLGHGLYRFRTEDMHSGGDCGYNAQSFAVRVEWVTIKWQGRSFDGHRWKKVGGYLSAVGIFNTSLREHHGGQIWFAEIRWQQCEAEAETVVLWSWR